IEFVADFPLLNTQWCSALYSEKAANGKRGARRSSRRVGRTEDNDDRAVGGPIGIVRTGSAECGPVAHSAPVVTFAIRTELHGGIGTVNCCVGVGDPGRSLLHLATHCFI